MALDLRNRTGAGRCVTSSGIIMGVLESSTPFVFASNAMWFAFEVLTTVP